MNISPTKLPMGCEDFRILIDKKLLFVDKTLLIKELIDNDGTTVSLITRPRRFGKTLNLSMLHYFFAEKIKNKPTKNLFNGLKISEAGEHYMKHQGQYPVINVSFKRLKGKTYEVMLNRMRELIGFTYKQHLELLDSPYLVKQQKNSFEAMLEDNATEAHLEASLLNLSEYLYMHYKKEVIILIDEYDTPIESSYVNGYYSEAVEMMRELLGACLKTNPYLERAVLTGITRVSKESLFSGLNNIAVYSLLNRQYEAYFGFTEEEVNRLIRKMNYQDKLVEMKAWYNGYKIGDTTLYNPWSIISCMKNEGLLQSYWVNTSGNELIKDLLINSSLDFKKDFEYLLKGETIHKFIREDMVFSDLDADESLIWSLLFVAGYLKIVTYSKEPQGEGFYCELSIPNREIHYFYCSLITTWLRGKQKPEWSRGFVDNLLIGNVEGFKEGLNVILKNIASMHDLAKDPEPFYHGLVLGFLSMLKNYELKSNRESGDGRYDIAVIPRYSQVLGLLFELKRIKETVTDTVLLNQAQKALKQINDKNYVAEFKQRRIHKVLKIALAFNGKNFQLCYEEEQLN